MLTNALTKNELHLVKQVTVLQTQYWLAITQAGTLCGRL
jgi:hypothetical protein